MKNGQPVEVDYRVTSNGSALMSEIKGKEDMISMFHLDGDRVLMTHYCGAGNQPRMVASASPDGKTFTFDFLDATNLATPDAAPHDSPGDRDAGRESPHRRVGLQRPRQRA